MFFLRNITLFLYNKKLCFLTEQTLLDSRQLVERATEILGRNESQVESIRQAARSEIESRFSFTRNSLPAYRSLIAEVTALA
jgi:hypothetical protein